MALVIGFLRKHLNLNAFCKGKGKKKKRVKKKGKQKGKRKEKGRTLEKLPIPLF